MDGIAVFIRNPDDGEFSVLIKNASMGAATRPDGTIIIKIMDMDTQIPILIPYEGDNFQDMVDHLQKVAGARIVTADLSDMQAEIKDFPQKGPDGNPAS